MCDFSIWFDALGGGGISVRKRCIASSCLCRLRRFALADIHPGVLHVRERCDWCRDAVDRQNPKSTGFIAFSTCSQIFLHHVHAFACWQEAECRWEHNVDQLRNPGPGAEKIQQHDQHPPSAVKALGVHCCVHEELLRESVHNLNYTVLLSKYGAGPAVVSDLCKPLGSVAAKHGACICAQQRSKSMNTLPNMEPEHRPQPSCADLDSGVADVLQTQ